MEFEIIDVSGDVGIRAGGRDLEEIFKNAAKGLYSLITNIDDVRPEISHRIEIKAHEPDSLIVRFLNELIFLFDAYGFIGNRIDIESSLKGISHLHEVQYKELWLKAEIKGEDFDPLRHERKLLVKAATYHNLRFYKEDDLWKVEIIFDI
ncbi:MAG: archease [Thermodesulfovibrionales bacterium]